MKDIVIYGFGDYGKEVACILQAINETKQSWNLLGYIDDNKPKGGENRYGKVIGDIHTLNSYQKELSVIIAIASSKAIQSIVKNITNPNISFPNIIAPNTLYFDKASLTIGIGNLVGFGCRISCDVKVGNFNLLNGCVSLGHDVTIGDYNIIQPDVRLSGKVSLSNANYFGAKSLVLQGIKIGDNTRIGAGSVIIRKTKDGELYWGNPAKKITTHK